MLNLERGSRLTTLIAVLAGLVLAPYALADDEDDVLAVIYQYGELEDDLDAQAKMMRDDRVFIAGGARRTDEAKNMAIQKANRAAGEAANGGKTKFITTIESPVVAVYGDVAVASFVRIFNVFPHNQPPAPAGTPNWVTLVLVKEGGEWGIAHTHQSPIGGN
jgi:ketosteroid isomerase-like protein